ncbi:MAG: ATP-binding domain-containing protein [Anaerolineales bacterium]|nr:ATP-binding domain-containing protein [Anaerolineales bacterium]
MLTFLASSPDYDKDETTKTVWRWIEEKFSLEDGVCYYKHPIVTANTGAIPELTFLAKKFQPAAIRCLAVSQDDIVSIEEDVWNIRNDIIDSPLLELDDFVIGLRAKFDKDRLLRRRINPIAVLAFPLITKSDFEAKFGSILEDTFTIWADGDLHCLETTIDSPLDDIEWRLTRSIVQGIRPLKNISSKVQKSVITLGAAIRELDNQIALLDIEQEKASIQIAPGPQRIRGLAGTGKTVLLAMKAANIHLKFPDKKILFTFNTQSLYNQTRSLITKFYRFYGEVDPNWDMLHVRHGWGGRNRPGVYYDLCSRQGVSPLSLDDVRRMRTRLAPFQVCCQQALRSSISPEYDFILIDEAQDFPKEFFEILYHLSHEPHQIYWAYDELQSLSSLEIQKPEEMFGMEEDGNPRVSIEGDDYPGGIEKDLVLHKSYRCPHSVLMVAHAIGLGIYSENGAVQMLQNRESWEAIGYTIEEGELSTGSAVTIFRPSENSPNQIDEIYGGSQDLITAKVFETREDELIWIAKSIINDVKNENVLPHDIVVISLDNFNVRSNFAVLQSLILQKGIPSTIPGLIDDTAAYAEDGKVTLSTVFRAKGNEAPVVYIMAFEEYYDYVEPVEGRNKAFTSISRSKAWVRISGTGRIMQSAMQEINKVIQNYPRFKFVFPNMDEIRRLDAETGKRRREIQKAKLSTNELLKLDPQAIAALARTNPELVDELVKRISEAKSDYQ